MPFLELARLLVMVALAAIPALFVFEAVIAGFAFLMAAPWAWLLVLIAFGLYWRFIRPSA
jgi:hypothetical protein